MVFNSLHFVWFFLVVYALYRVLPHRGQNWLLLVASYYFYAAWDYRFVALLAASTLVDYTLRARARRDDATSGGGGSCMWLSIGFNLAMLGVLQVLQFLRRQPPGAVRRDRLAARLRHGPRAAADRHLVLHVRHDELRHRRLPPRDRADAQLRRLRRVRRVLSAPGRGPDPARDGAAAADRRRRAAITAAQIRDGLWLIAWGFFQKIFVADNLAPIADARVRRRTRTPTGVNVLLGTYAFAFQIYGDFAGYSNIARGTSKLMGIELIENFRFPYLVHDAAGLLAPLAHQPLDLAARLPL